MLGVDQQAPIEEVEASYRLLLRRFNPQALADTDPATKADASIRVREIHAAMAQVRKDHHGGGPRPWPFRADGEDLDDEPGAAAEPIEAEQGLSPAMARAREQDWSFDDLLELVPCPYCDQGFLELEPFRNHLAADHQYRLREKRKRKARTEPTVIQLLGVWRCAVAGAFALAAAVTLVLGLSLWFPMTAMIVVLIVLFSVAIPKADRHSFGHKRVKQHKAIKWF